MSKPNIVIDLTDEDHPQVTCNGRTERGVEGFGYHDNPVWRVARAVRDFGDDFADIVSLGSQDSHASDSDYDPEEEEAARLPNYCGYAPDGGFVVPVSHYDYREMRAAQWRASRELGPPLDTSGKHVVPPRRKRPLPK
eukprot:gene10980-12212_t